MQRNRVLALRQSIKPPVRTMLVSSFENEPVEFHYPDALAVMTGLVQNPILSEFFLNETAENKPAVKDFTIAEMVALFNRMGPYAIASIIASAMRNPETGASYVSDPEVEGWIRDWSPNDQISAFLAIHEVTNLIDFFERLWSLAKEFHVGQQMDSAIKSVLGNYGSARKQSSESDTGLNFDPNLIVASRPNASSSGASSPTPPSASAAPSVESAAAA